MVLVDEEGSLRKPRIDHPYDASCEEGSEGEEEQEQEVGSEETDMDAKRRRELDDLEQSMSAFPSKGLSLDSRSPDKKRENG